MNQPPSAKKKMGRPRKDRGWKDQLVQISVRISRETRTGLDVLARELGVTLAEAAAYAIRRTLHGYEIELTDGSKMTADRMGSLIERIESGEIQPKGPNSELFGPFLRETGMYRIGLLPERLRTAAERYRYAVGQEFGGVDTAEEIQAFLEAVDIGFASGTEPAEVAANLAARLQRKRS